MKENFERVFLGPKLGYNSVDKQRTIVVANDGT
jgi:hypothetical protein